MMWGLSWSLWLEQILRFLSHLCSLFLSLCSSDFSFSISFYSSYFCHIPIHFIWLYNNSSKLLLTSPKLSQGWIVYIMPAQCLHYACTMPALCLHYASLVLLHHFLIFSSFITFVSVYRLVVHIVRFCASMRLEYLCSPFWGQIVWSFCMINAILGA